MSFPEPPLQRSMSENPQSVREYLRATEALLKIENLSDDTSHSAYIESSLRETARRRAEWQAVARTRARHRLGQEASVYRDIPIDVRLSGAHTEPTLHPHLPTASLEGPTADSCEKGGRLMSNSPYFLYRVEVERYFRSCESFLAATAATATKPFSKEEGVMMGYYAAEIEKILAASTKK